MGVDDRHAVSARVRSDVRQRSGFLSTEVCRAVEGLALDGGFILSALDNVRGDTPTSRRNVEALVTEWRRLTVKDRRGVQSA